MSTDKKAFLDVFPVLADEILGELRKHNMPQDAYDWVKNVSTRAGLVRFRIEPWVCFITTFPVVSTSLVVVHYFYTPFGDHLRITAPALLLTLSSSPRPTLAGKLNRGLSVVDTLRILRGDNITDEELFHARILGWTVEWVSSNCPLPRVLFFARETSSHAITRDPIQLQAFFLVADDIMDSSYTRRGQPCWFRKENVGMVAINDGIILESSVYIILKKYFKKTQYYVELLELYHEVTFQTELGQLLDLITAPEDNVDLSKFSPAKHQFIVIFKTAYYSFYLPVALAMLMAGVKNENAYSQARDILIPLGEYFQVQDDYLDCYGAPEVIGKIGTDIQDNKCSWLVNQALVRITPEQRKILDQHYGKKDSKAEAAVKQLYIDIDIESVYKAYEEKSYTEISAMIAKVDESTGVKKEVFTEYMNKIYKRTK
ncbi:geranyltranstransferase [Jimgerdemannia flammicorona]|uniref:Farnesyl pyrophosphate synthase n=1 Tax=Jimgerdemannia flammicorona TaxID=994334 RepID=A0A433D149_9FUNG|nr:geranyltranstransferase [Jimgerdemannia flammicorona]